MEEYKCAYCKCVDCKVVLTKEQCYYSKKRCEKCDRFYIYKLKIQKLHDDNGSNTMLNSIECIRILFK